MSVGDTSNIYYKKIKQLNLVHYAGEISYYSNAELRPAELELLKQLPQGSTILDVGTGSGRFSINAAKLGFKVTGIDITPEAIAACKKRARQEKLRNINFMVADITEKKLSVKYDYVFCPRFVINAIATDKHRRKAISNMLEACKPGGKIFIESFNIMWLGQGIFTPILNLARSFIRQMRLITCQLFKKPYTGLFPGDITYPANKAKNASDGYAHLPTIFEIKSYLKHGETKSIYEITNIKKKDWLKSFRYSIWIIHELPRP